MYADFKYLCPSSLNELFHLLSDCGEDALLYAGGTDLLVQLRAKKASAKYIIDIKKIPELNGIDETDYWISVGAACRFSDIQSDALIVRWAKSLADAAGSIGSVQIRFKGTIGGNIQTASPAGDALNAAWGLGAEVGILSAAGERRLPIADFVLAPHNTILQKDEVIARVYIPKRKWSYQGFFKTGRRNAMAISVVNGVVALMADESGAITDARISLGAVAPTPLRIPQAEQVLIGRPPDISIAEQAADIVRKNVQPISDLRAGAEYRAYIAGVSVKRQIIAYMEGAVK